MTISSKFAAQLYTVRDLLKDDFPGVLRTLKAMGWAAVQISGLHGYAAEEIASVLQETGLRTAGTHVPLSRLTDEFAAVVAEARQFETRDIVCPSLPDQYKTAEGYLEVRRILNEVARQAEAEGLRLSYHNHDFEFKTIVEGGSALEYLLKPTNDNRLLAEIDVYWVKKGGRDPLSFIQPYANRMPIIHLKDMSGDGREAFAEIGTGLIDFAPLLAWGEQSGVEFYAVEQDVCPGNPLDSLKQSLDNLRQIIGN